jgi:hypothetical protein
MAIDQDHDRKPEDGDDFERVREELKQELNEEARRQMEIMDELWESGKMEEMIDNEDFSDLPDELRPEGYTDDDEGDSDPYDPSEEFEADE